MGKGPGLYTDIGKKARDLLYRDYNADQKFTVTTISSTGVAITSAATKKGDFFLADVSTQLKNKNVTTDIKVDTSSNLLTTITVDEPAPGLKAICSFIVPDQKSGRVELQYLHDYAGISTTVGLTPNPVVNISGVVGSSFLALGTDVSFDTKSGNFTKCNAGLSFANEDLIASLTLNNKGDSVNASYYHIVNPLSNTAVGAEVSHSFSSNENTITMGTQHSLDPIDYVEGTCKQCSQGECSHPTRVEAKVNIDHFRRVRCQQYRQESQVWIGVGPQTLRHFSLLQITT